MKLTIIFAVCMAIVAVHSASVSVEDAAVHKQPLERQRFIFDMVRGMNHDLQVEEYIKLGSKLNTDTSLYANYTKYMTQFEHFDLMGATLPRGEFFSGMERTSFLQAYGLFEFFYYAKDWETLVQNIAWARMNVNEGMFVHALTLAVIHRPDMEGIILPQIYEIFPQMFFCNKYIIAAEQFDWDTFNRQIMLEKELKTIYEHEGISELVGDRIHMKEWKVWQWWKLMGLDDGWKLEDKSTALEAHDPLYNSIYNKNKMVWMPVDYTRDISIMNDDSKMSYFTEDVSWNAYWYYLNMDYSKVLNGEKFNLGKDRRGEWWIYNVQQILARYYMERLSQGLGEFDTLSWYGVVETGYDPQLVAYNGNGFTFRKNYWQVDSHQNLDILNKIISIESRIDDVIASGRFTMRNGTVIDLTLPESVELIGNLLQGNIDVLDRHFFFHWTVLASTFLSGEKYRDFIIAPNAILNSETMLRDPLTYCLLKRIVEKYCQFNYQLTPYTKQELLLPGVNIIDVEFDKLMTSFDLVDIDVTTLHNEKLNLNDGKFVPDEALLFRQQRLTNDGVNYTMNLMVSQPQTVVVRSFIGPAFDNNGQKMNFNENRESFMEFDEFIYDLTEGRNHIYRSSANFTWTSGDAQTFTEMYSRLLMSYEDKYPFYQNTSQSHSLFPSRLILPRGWVKGMPMITFFMVSPYTADYKQYASYDPYYQSGIGSGVRHIDNMPFGYPLERKIDDLYEFLVPNMFIKKVKIYHRENLDKYYPMKYEHFGEFDQDF